MGYLLLLFSLILFFKKKYTYSFLIYFSFLLNGFRILPDVFLGAKLTHMSFIYALTTSFFFICTKNEYFKRTPLTKTISALIIYIFCSVIFSWQYYGFPISETIAVGLRFIIIISFFTYLKLPSDVSVKVIKVIVHVTFFTSILYIAQAVSGIQLLAYSYETYDTPGATGLFVFYNSPPVLIFSLFISFFTKGIIQKKYTLLYKIIFITCLISSMFRTSIVAAIVCLLLGFIIRDGILKNIKQILLIAIICLPLFSLVATRFSSGNTSKDLNLIIQSDYSSVSYNGGGNGATMAYRAAWILERIEYLKHRPISESLFGLGLMTDESPSVNKKYKFLFGLVNKETGRTAQLRTPDIAWGTMLTILGIIGSIIWTIIWLKISLIAYRNKRNMLSHSLFLTVIYIFLTSISGNLLADPFLLSFYLFIIASIIKNNKSKDVYE